MHPGSDSTLRPTRSGTRHDARTTPRRCFPSVPKEGNFTGETDTVSRTLAFRAHEREHKFHAPPCSNDCAVTSHTIQLMLSHPRVPHPNRSILQPYAVGPMSGDKSQPQEKLLLFVGISFSTNRFHHQPGTVASIDLSMNGLVYLIVITLMEFKLHMLSSPCCMLCMEWKQSMGQLIINHLPGPINTPSRRG